MKRILNLRTVRVALDRADKRLAQIEVKLAELQAEREKVNQLRAVLMPMPLPLTAPEPNPGQPVPVDGPSFTLVESGDCFWAIGAHQHRIAANGDLCLAPEEQRRKP